MAQLHKLAFETEAKCSADKYFGLFSQNATQLPGLLPEIFKSVEFIEGDGTRVGSVRLSKYVMGEMETTSKDKIIAFDQEKRSFTVEVMEGEIMNYYKSFSAKLDVVPKQCAAGNECFVKWSLEFEKVNENIPDPTGYIDAIKLVTKELISQVR